MSPAEDAPLLLASVRRPLRGLRFGLDSAYREEDWGFTAQQALEKLLKAWIVLADRRPPRVHDLADLADLAALAALAGQPLDLRLLERQVFAGEARDAEGPFPLPAPRQVVLEALEHLLERCTAAVQALGDSAGDPAG